MWVTILSRNTISVIAAIFLFTSCQSYNKSFFVKNDGAVMPVKVRGNSESKEYIVLLPGGPSGDGLIYSKIFPVFRERIESNYKMVYYDQRGAGNCQGIYETNSLNLKQLGEDLNRVIQSIQIRDKEAKIYLLGYSYGGTLGMNYLMNSKNQESIKGFISIAGAFDRKRQRENQQRLIEYFLERWVAEGELTNYDAIKGNYHCNDAVDRTACKTDSVETLKKVELKLDELEKYNQFRITGGSILKLLGYTFFSQGNPIQSGIAEGQNGKHYQKEFNEQLLSEQVHEVSVPILLINGRYDTNVPFFEAEEVYRNIGTPATKKRIIILEESGHLPMLTEPEKLSKSIEAFISAN